MPTDYELMQAAEAACENAYAPYSGFKVGAALLTGDGRIYTGCNVENSSYGAAICAERTAAVKAVSEGCVKFNSCCTRCGSYFIWGKPANDKISTNESKVKGLGSPLRAEPSGRCSQAAKSVR